MGAGALWSVADGWGDGANQKLGALRMRYQCWGEVEKEPQMLQSRVRKPGGGSATRATEVQKKMRKGRGVFF